MGCYTLYNSSREKEQLAAFVYDIPALAQQVRLARETENYSSRAGNPFRSFHTQVTDGQPPRKMEAVIPKHAPSKGGNKANSRLLEHLRNGTWKTHQLVAVQTRAPTYHEGQYRLNFSGR